MHNKKTPFTLFIFFFISLCTQLTVAQPLDITISGNKALVNIELPGDITADLSIAFEEVVGLTPSSLGISAELININNLALLNRLPNLQNNLIPAAFPMMITIEPPANQGLSFSGIVTIDIHTHNLEYTVNTPLRLFKAPLGGQFKDITMTTGSGSYRARGTTGKFSQFLIVTDVRSPIQVTNAKLSSLHSELLNAVAVIEPSVYSLLNVKLAEVDLLVTSQNYVSASAKVNEFILLLSEYSGDDIPSVWRSSRDINNIAGELIAQANSLRYSLHLTI